MASVRGRFTLQPGAAVDEPTRRLLEFGFKVLRSSRFGIDVEAESAVFERVLGTAVVAPRGGTARFADEPTIPPALKEYVASVYLPTPPVHFGGDKRP